jgi:CheY-like chemotaxis protein
MNHTAILYAEDETSDVLFMRHAWTKAGLSNPLHVVEDGEQAVAYLAGQGKYADREQYPLPSLVLLDLKMPKLHGLDVLRWIREQPAIRLLPVMVLSSSNKPQDVCAAYEQHVNAYLMKPLGLQDLVQMVAHLRDFWLRHVELPPQCPDLAAGFRKARESASPSAPLESKVLPFERSRRAFT